MDDDFAGNPPARLGNIYHQIYWSHRQDAKIFAGQVLQKHVFAIGIGIGIGIAIDFAIGLISL